MLSHQTVQCLLGCEAITVPWNLVFLEDFLGPTKALTLQPRCMIDGMFATRIERISYSVDADKQQATSKAYGWNGMKIKENDEKPQLCNLDAEGADVSLR